MVAAVVLVLYLPHQYHGFLQPKQPQAIVRPMHAIYGYEGAIRSAKGQGRNRYGAVVSVANNSRDGKYKVSSAISDYQVIN
jgi:hypothetical protein